MRFSRGLAALIFAFTFQTALQAKYLYIDEVVDNPKFNTEVEKLGTELYEKTGISLRLIMIRDLPNGMNIMDYENEIMKDFNEPTVILTFAELNSKVDILANDTSLYKHFNKKQVLSPVASPVQAFVVAVLYAKDFDNFMMLAGDSGGTILPLLGDKPKKGERVAQYSGSLFNGYFDIAEQIAVSKGVELSNATGEGSKNLIFIIKFLFYGVVLMGTIMYIRRKLFLRRQKLGLS